MFIDRRLQYTEWAKKVNPKLLFISSPNINRFLKFFHCYTQQEICNKDIITDFNRPKKCHYTTLQNISFQKIASTESTVMEDQAC